MESSVFAVYSSSRDMLHHSGSVSRIKQHASRLNNTTRTIKRNEIITCKLGQVQSLFNQVNAATLTLLRFR